MNRARGWADDNVAQRPVVLVTEDPASGAWREISAPAFGDPDNESINELAVFADTIWAATLNRRTGFQLWRADGRDDASPQWTQILTKGAFRGPASPVPASMTVFDGALYIGTGVQRQPGQGTDRFGPIAPELIRVRPDGTWDLICGEARLTPDGLKRPLSGLGPGFDDMFVQAFWRMAAHGGALYIGGSDWRFWPTYLPRGGASRPDLSPLMEEWLETETGAWNGDWSFWRSVDGVTWDTLTTSGLGGNPQQYGLREVLSNSAGLWAAPAAR